LHESPMSVHSKLHVGHFYNKVIETFLLLRFLDYQGHPEEI